MDRLEKKLHSTYLDHFRNSAIDIQIKARRILYANFLMILISIALLPFSTDETILLPATIVLSVAGFLLSIYFLKNGWIARAAWLHVIILSCVGLFLHVYIGDSYNDSLTFMLVSFIFLINCSIISVDIRQFFFMAASLFLSMVLAPFVNESRDISRRKRTQETIIQSEKMMSVGGLAAGMAHEINNPLAGVIQNAGVAVNRLTDRDMPANQKAAESAGTSMDAISQFMESRKIVRMLNSIVESGNRMAAIVDNMLSFARKSDLSFSTHDPVRLMDRTLALAATGYDLKKRYDFKHIILEKEYERDLPMISCQATKIQQVILNVLTNGAYAMFESPDSAQPRFKIRLRHEPGPDMLRIEIEDNGPGMDHQTAKRIFDPFFTTKPAGSGTGLGLSVSYFIVTEDHKGTMTVSSKIGKGANFIIRLPIKTGQ